MIEEPKELLRFSTAGSVDDGKSTLIGRLLLETGSVYEDQLAAVAKSGINRSTGPIDLSLLTDGLRAEREQGITIDVAYRYFQTPRRKFIIADTPGHEQYTRNMATGASTADLAIVLIDARKGVLPQSKRHAFIASLLGIPHVAVAINKMDLVDFSETVFHSIEADFRAFAADLQIPFLQFFPVSALDGDNIVSKSARTPWYDGPAMLEYLETVPLDAGRNFKDLRFPVQYVVRPNLDFRGFAGQLASGILRPGDTVMALPSGRTTKVKSLPSFDGSLTEAFPPMAVTVELEDEIDISRGDMLVDPRRMPHVSRRLEAHIVWMQEVPLEAGNAYLLKHTTQTVTAHITEIRHRIEINTMAKQPSTGLGLNEIGLVQIEAKRPLFYDIYQENRNTGCFILIDPETNATAGAGMITEAAWAGGGRRKQTSLQLEEGVLTPAERYKRNGHYPVTIWLTARKELAYLLERRLFDRGCQVHVLADDHETNLLPEFASVLNHAGVMAICSIASDDNSERDRAAAAIDRFVAIDPAELSTNDDHAVNMILSRLEQTGFLPSEISFDSGEGI